jgi:hypothetical protein
MTQLEKEKLEVIFHKKYMELAFEYNPRKKTWKSYLESIKCTVRTAPSARDWASLTENYYTKFDSLIKDPSPFGGYIQISEEDSLKILALGLP